MANKRLKKLLKKLLKRLRRFGSRSVPYVVSAVLVFVVLVIAGQIFRSQNLSSVRDQDLTATITATTESLSFSLQDDRQSAWNLPAGTFFVAGDEPPNTSDEQLNFTCNEKTENFNGVEMFVGYSCEGKSPTRLEIDGAADITIILTPAGILRVTVKPNENKDLTIRLMNEKNKRLISSSQEIGFETIMPFGPDIPDDNYQVRIPLIATVAQVGQPLHYVSTTNDSPESFWQPILLSGSVSMIARNFPDSEKYNVLNESLDAGDVLGVGFDINDPDEKKAGASSKPLDDSTARFDPHLIWGMATIGYQNAVLSGTTEIEQFMIHVVLHTTHRELSVQRFGAQGGPAQDKHLNDEHTMRGHTIRASEWTIISRWPNGQKAWVSFMSLVVILTLVFQFGDVIRNNSLKTKKKGKKHLNRKRNGD